MTEDKKKLLLDVALEHFAAFGYEKASTNQMIRQAGISKGILFHYFSSKKQLYAAALDRALEKIAAYRKAEPSDDSSDLFESIINTGYRKIYFYLQEPDTYKLLVGAFSEPVPYDVKDVIAERMQRMKEQMSIRPEQVDLSRIRAGVNPALAFDLATNVVTLLSNRFIERNKERPDRGLARMESFLDELRQYLEMLESGIYQSNDKGRNGR